MLLTSNSTITFSRNETSLGQSNCSYLFAHSTAEKIYKIFAYCFILLGSFLGNISIIIIVYRHRYLRKTVNYFIVNMAVSDLLFPLSVIPVEITQLITNSWHWHVSGILGSILCTSFYFIRDFSLHVSTQSLVWIAVDRFIAVLFPIKVGLISTRIRTIAITSTWIFAGMSNIPWLLTSKLVECDNNTFCVVIMAGPVFPNQKAIAAYTWLHVTFVSITPLFLITHLYSVIAVSLKIQNKALTDTTLSLQRHSLRKRGQAIQMAVTIVVFFYICLIPQTLVYFVSHLRPSGALLRPQIFFIAMFALCSSSVVNPMICLSFVGSYRRGLKNILCSCCRKRNNKVAKCEEMTLNRIRHIPDGNWGDTENQQETVWWWNSCGVTVWLNKHEILWERKQLLHSRWRVVEVRTEKEIKQLNFENRIQWYFG